MRNREGAGGRSSVVGVWILLMMGLVVVRWVVRICHLPTMLVSKKVVAIVRGRSAHFCNKAKHMQRKLQAEQGGRDEAL